LRSTADSTLMLVSRPIMWNGRHIEPYQPDGSVLPRSGLVDIAASQEPDGREVFNNIRYGVFVTFKEGEAVVRAVEPGAVGHRRHLDRRLGAVGERVVHLVDIAASQEPDGREVFNNIRYGVFVTFKATSEYTKAGRREGEAVVRAVEPGAVGHRRHLDRRLGAVGERARSGLVDIAASQEPDGREVFNNIRYGVFVTFKATRRSTADSTLMLVSRPIMWNGRHIEPYQPDGSVSRPQAR
jgi:predicted homoserine dehydrogenase-like protein